MSEHCLLQLEWGDVPAWVGAIFTSTSLLIAALSYRRSILDRERDQASKVAAWITLIDEHGQSKRILRISNGSDASIYDLTCRLEGEEPVPVKELPAKAVTTVNLGGAGPAPKIAKQERLGVPTFSLEMTTTTEIFSQEPSPEIEFSDALGRWWRRSTDGKLERIRSRTTTTTHTTSKSLQWPGVKYRTERPDETEQILGVFYGARRQVGQQYIITNRRLLMGPLDTRMFLEITSHTGNKAAVGTSDFLMNVLNRYASMSPQTLWLHHVVDVRSTNNAIWGIFKAPGLKVTTDTGQVFKLSIAATLDAMNRDPKNYAVRDQALEAIKSAVEAAKAAPPKPV